MFEYNFHFHMAILIIVYFGFIILEIQIRKVRKAKNKTTTGLLRMDREDYVHVKRYVYVAASLGIAFVLYPLLSDMMWNLK